MLATSLVCAFANGIPSRLHLLLPAGLTLCSCCIQTTGCRADPPALANGLIPPCVQDFDDARLLAPQARYLMRVGRRLFNAPTGASSESVAGVQWSVCMLYLALSARAILRTRCPAQALHIISARSVVCVCPLWD
ncbi:MAG TPA: hypothetical protein VGF67_04260 [Ktedonobacteraceae bacterium]